MPRLRFRRCLLQDFDPCQFYNRSRVGLKSAPNTPYPVGYGPSIPSTKEPVRFCAIWFREIQSSCMVGRLGRLRRMGRPCRSMDRVSMVWEPTNIGWGRSIRIATISRTTMLHFGTDVTASCSHRILRQRPRSNQSLHMD